MSTTANNKLSYHESLPICGHAHCLQQASVWANHSQMFHWLHPILHNTQFISELITNFRLVAYPQDPAAVGRADGRRANSFIFPFWTVPPQIKHLRNTYT
jgi:hypothetical protein